MRITGRLLRPSTLAERRFLLSLGIPALRVPRRINPYAIARRLQRAIAGRTDDLLAVRELVMPRAKARHNLAPHDAITEAHVHPRPVLDLQSMSPDIEGS
jgi:hypothetical protein